MFKLSNVKLRSKLLIMLVIPLSALIAVSAVSIYRLNSAVAELVDKLHEKTNGASSALLNADRDYYQAIEVQQRMEKTNNPVELEELAATYKENAQQVLDRTQQVYAIISENQDIYGSLKHQTSKLTLLELLDTFNRDYGIWSGQFDPDTNTLKDRA